MGFWDQSLTIEWDDDSEVSEQNRQLQLQNEQLKELLLKLKRGQHRNVSNKDSKDKQITMSKNGQICYEE